MLSKWRVYIKPFDDYGEYADWIDVTDDVDFGAMGSIALDLDNTEFDIGVARNSSFTLTLRNEHGQYSDVETSQTIFKTTRANSLCKVTWDVQEDVATAGFSLVEQCFLGEEHEIFVGLLNDESLSMDLNDHKVKFQVLGRESIFMKTVVPFGTISAGDLVSEVIFNCLDQDAITNILTVDADNINLGIDQAIDSIASLQNKTVQEALNKLLLSSNSVLYIDDGAVIVAPRTESATVVHEFFGQASAGGLENICSIKKIRNGLSRAFNYLTWKDTTVVASDDTSVSRYGVRKKEIDVAIFTNGTKQTNILDSLLDDFGMPKQEFDLTTTIDFGTIAIKMLDKVSIDYPTIPISDFPLPICGGCIAGEAVTPKMLWSFEVLPTDYYKVIGRSIDIKSSQITFKMRAV